MDKAAYDKFVAQDCREQNDSTHDPPHPRRT